MHRLWIVVVLSIWLSGCTTMNNQKARNYCRSWAHEQVRLGAYSHGTVAYVDCMHRVGHGDSVTIKSSNCGVSGLRCGG